MKLDRLTHSPGVLADFYAEALHTLGAVCERTWHDRLHVLAEGSSARLWNDTGALHEVELWFPPPEDTAPRQAEREVFPGCPSTFRLAEALRPSPLELERVVLEVAQAGQPPAADVAAKCWHSCFPSAQGWQPLSPFVADWHFSLLALLRCEIQAIDQHWSLRRIAVSLTDGATDETLAGGLDLASIANGSRPDIPWPQADPHRWRILLQAALELDIAADLAGLRERQERHLRRELDRVDDYFDHYEKELASRGGRSRSETVKVKTAERLAAAKAEHARRRADQVARHEIRVETHLDALLLVTEPAWHTRVAWREDHRPRQGGARFVPRLRRWMLDASVA